MRSLGELLVASGYGEHPKEFADLLRILDREVRLITPTDPEGNDDEDREPPATAEGKNYQLTHDYLVPSIREWLTRKQRETRRGRAELLLEDLTNSWKKRDAMRPEDAYLAERAETLELLTQIDPSTLTGDKLLFLTRSARRIFFDMVFVISNEKFNDKFRKLKAIIYTEKLLYAPYIYVIIIIFIYFFGILPKWLWVILLIMSLVPILMTIYSIYKLIHAVKLLKKKVATPKPSSGEAAFFDLMLKFHKEKSRLQSSETTESDSLALAVKAFLKLLLDN